MQYFITGADGVIGSHVVRQLAARDGAVVTVLEGDIRDRTSVHAQLAAARPDVVIHLAALVPVKEVAADPAAAYAVNVGGTLHLMEGLAGLGSRPRVFYASTSHVYAPQDEPLREDAPIGPRNLYATTKHLGECIVTGLGEALEAPTCIGRMFSFYDEAQAPAYLYPAIRKRLATEDLGAPFELFGAHAVRDLSPAADMAAYVVALVDRQAEGIVNLGSGEGIRIMDFVQAQTETPLDIVPRGSAETLVADTTRLRSLLGDEEAAG